MARINMAKNFAGEIYATQTWVEGKNYATETFVTDKGYATTGYVDGKISSLGNVFELKELVETLPATAEIGDVYLVNETVDGQTFTAEYVYTGTGFEKLGIATSPNSYATKSYVDTTFATKTDVDSNFVKATQFKSGKGASATVGTDDNGNTLTVEAKVSTADGNRLSLTDNGLYVPAIVASDVVGFISATDTNSIDMDYTNGVIKGDVKTSATTGNILEIKNDGLFVPNTNTDNYHTFTSSNSIEFVDTEFNVTANVKQSATEGNRLTIETDGLYVPAIVASDVRGFISVEDTDTIDMNYVEGKITANAIGLGLKGDAGNSFAIADKATTVWAAISALDGVVNTLQGGGEGQEGIISRVEKVEALSKKNETLSQKNARNIEKNHDSIVSLEATTDALIVDNGMLKTAIEATNEDVVAVQTTANKLVTDNVTLKDAIVATNDDVEAVKTTANALVADIDTVKTSVNGAIEDVKGIVTEFNDAKLTTLDSKTVTLTKGDNGNVSGAMAKGQIVFAVLDGSNQVYPDIVYSDGVATLSADYGTTTAPETWTVYFGKVVTLTASDVAEVGTLTAKNAVIDATVGTLTASNATVDATVGTLTASNATVGEIEAYSDAEKGTTAQA